MDKKLKTKWVKALRSGKYEQCQHSLYDGKGYCCLGVLLEVAGEKRELPGTITGGQDIRLGLGDAKACLESMNDGINDYQGKKKSFKQIANWIESHL